MASLAGVWNVSGRRTLRIKDCDPVAQRLDSGGRMLAITPIKQLVLTNSILVN
jgi:hypothetical protein